MDFTKPKTLVVSLAAIIAALVVLAIFIVILRHGDAIDYENNTVGWGVNKTVGWAWDLYNFTPFLCFIVLVIFLLWYTILWILSARLNKLVSIFNLVTLLTFFIVLPFDRLINIWIIALAAVSLSILLFMTNAIFAIVYKISDKKEKQKP